MLEDILNLGKEKKIFVVLYDVFPTSHCTFCAVCVYNNKACLSVIPFFIFERFR